VFSQPPATQLLPGYGLRRGRQSEQGRLLAFMTCTYQEMYPQGEFGHLSHTVAQFLSPDAPFWLVEPQESTDQKISVPIACLWLGRAIDQVSGHSHTHILLLYVDPLHRRRGIGSALVNYAEAWAIQRGEQQLGLQVFMENHAARQLYQHKGFICQSMWMTKGLPE
jgi:GNAT superfamily N-acetyltransferase